MTLYCIRKDGKREQAKLAHQTLADARELAIWVLQAGNGLYTEVDICSEDGTIETIPHAAVATASGKT
jgi:hypothetical protein